MNASYKTSIQFNDLYIPVKLLKISYNSAIELNQLCKYSKERVRYRKYCHSCNKEIHNEDIVKGYCYSNHPDKFVTLTNEDIKSIITDEDKVLKIQHFCKPKEINDLLIDKSYYVVPELDGEKQYNLLRRAMVSNRVVGIAEIVLGTKQELVALFANKDCIIAIILFYENEINELPIIFKHKTDKDDLDNLKATILENTREFNWYEHFDRYQIKLRELILSKIPK